jgi:hypothetical protein
MMQNNGVWRLLKLTNGNLVVGAQSVRFRRELSLWQQYSIETRLLCWDDRAFYLEHRFVTIDGKTHKPFVNAIILVKNTVIGKLSPAQLVEKLPGLDEKESANATMPEDVLKWIQSNDISSKALRMESTM